MLLHANVELIGILCANGDYFSFPHNMFAVKILAVRAQRAETDVIYWNCLDFHPNWWHFVAEKNRVTWKN